MTARTSFAHYDPADYCESDPTYTLDAQLAAWRAETPADCRAALDAEWAEGVRQSREDHLERIRVRHGRGSAQFRAAAIHYACSSYAEDV